jgi:hypothetical protein
VCTTEMFVLENAFDVVFMVFTELWK